MRTSVIALSMLLTLSGAAFADAGLTTDEVKHVVDGKIGDLKTCLKATSPTGKLVVHYYILPTGKVDKATVHESSTGNGVLDRCIVDVFKRLQFPTPHGGVTMEQLYPFTFAIAKPKVEEPAKLDPNVVVATVKEHNKEVLACTGETTKGKTGVLNVEIDIAETGAVTAVRKKDSTTKADPFDACVVAAVGKWTFPKPTGKGALTIVYPFAIAAKKTETKK